MKSKPRSVGVLIGGVWLLACLGSSMAAPQFTESTIQITPEAPLMPTMIRFVFFTWISRWIKQTGT